MLSGGGADGERNVNGELLANKEKVSGRCCSCEAAGTLIENVFG